MNVRQLINALTEDYVDMDAEVTTWAYNIDGKFVRWTIGKTTSTTRGVDLDLKEIAKPPNGSAQAATTDDNETPPPESVEAIEGNAGG